MGDFFKNLLLLVVSLLLITGLAEFAVRIAFHDITTTPNMQTWFGKRWQRQHVTLNEAGFRGQDAVMPRTAGTYRIAIVGDSFAFGQGIAEEDRFSNILARELTRDTTAVEVLNFGKPGATTKEELNILTEHVLPADPDFIIVQWLPNDFEDLQQRWAPRGSPLIDDRKLHRKMMLNSALYFLLNTQWNSINRSFDGGGVDYTEYLLAPVKDPASDEYRTAIQPMVDMLATLKDSGVRFAVILHPLLREELGADYPLAPLHQVVLDVCEAGGADCVDLTPVFAALGPDFDYMSLWVNQFDAHPGSAANRLVADYLVEYLGPEVVYD